MNSSLPLVLYPQELWTDYCILASLFTEEPFSLHSSENETFPRVYRGIRVFYDTNIVERPVKVGKIEARVLCSVVISVFGILAAFACCCCCRCWLRNRKCRQQGYCRSCKCSATQQGGFVAVPENVPGDQMPVQVTPQTGIPVATAPFAPPGYVAIPINSNNGYTPMWWSAFPPPPPHSMM